MMNKFRLSCRSSRFLTALILCALFILILSASNDARIRQSVEDYSYFHLVPASPHPTTIFGISCNRQIKSADLLVKDEEVTRSTVQKAVVVLAAKPFFGPIRFVKYFVLHARNLTVKQR